jgi:heat shock protein HtpX
VGWLPIIAVTLAGLAAIAAFRSRTDDEPSAARRALPFAILMVAALLAVVSTAFEAATDSRVGIREASTAALALLFGTPAVGWLIARLRWGAPGRRTFHQQIASNRASSIVLVIVLVEVLALTGFVIGSTVGTVIGAALASGLICAALSVGIGLAAAGVAARRGPRVVLDTVGATPLPDGYTVLRNVVTELSTAAGIRPPALYLIESPTANAFAVGADPDQAAIAVTSGLLERLDREELQGVIAHEIAHIRNLDSRYGLLVAVIVGAVVIMAAAFAALTSNMSVDADGIGSLIVGIVIAILLAIFGAAVKAMATAAARAVQASVSREREFLADATSVALTRNPAGLIRALDRIADQPAMATSAATEHLWFVSPLADEADVHGWFATHPSAVERIARLRALGGQLDALGLADVAVADPAVTAPVPADAPVLPLEADA